ncbi:tetratricopeptide repeat protein [Oculatella sp. LEGE 06141]|uniref:tetratricopeptide repeat protein n=1 Tax=Oculatella sp. LEGE 06141 TaxID=1828648 RepID=UPI00187FAE92|nr:tetratricopeptide repeat protein [Oculatella sp. LEGE 06141]MBE9178761.1 tetratricopeptide repeat protein [Oculatella sp. LEGE 06141]
MKKHHWLNVAEYASVVGLGVGSLASIVYTQMLYVSAPLSILVLLNLANRRRLEQETEQHTAIAVNELDQRLSQQIEQLNQQVMSLPTIETVGGIKKSLLLKNREVVEKLSGEIVAIQREFQDRLKLIEKQDLAAARLDINQLGEKCARHAEALADITSHLNRLSSIARVDGLENVVNQLKGDVSQLQSHLQEITSYAKPNLVSLQDQVANLNRQFKKIPAPVDQTALRQEMSELIRVVADLVPKREFTALTAQIRELNQQQEMLKQTVATLETHSARFGKPQEVPPAPPIPAPQRAAEPADKELDRQVDRLLSASELSQQHPDVQETITTIINGLQEQLTALHTSTQQLTEQQQRLYTQVNQLPKTLDAVAVQRQVQDITERIAHVESGTQLFQAQVEANLQRDLEQVNQKLRSLPAAPDYEFIFDLTSANGQNNNGSQTALQQALNHSQERLILICPWSDEQRLNGELLQQLKQFLQNNRQLSLGWCFQANRDENRLLNKLVRGWEVTPHQRTELQDTLRDLLKLKQAYPERFQFKVLGTAESFLVMDQTMAIVGIPEMLSTRSIFTQLQLKLRTTDSGVIQQLIQRFDNPLLDPSDLAAHWNRAVTRYELGDKQGAVADFTQVLSLDPNDAIAYNYRGLVRADLGDVEGAATDFTQALHHDPRMFAACCNRGFVALELGDYLAAIADFGLALQLQPQSAITYFYRGLASQKLGDLEGAIRDYSEALMLSPEAAVAYYYRGVTHQKVENWSEAIADLEAAARLFHELGSKANVQKALRILEKLKSAPPAKPAVANGRKSAAPHYSANQFELAPSETIAREYVHPLGPEASLANSEQLHSSNGHHAHAENPVSNELIQVVDVEVLGPEMIIDPVFPVEPEPSHRSPSKRTGHSMRSPRPTTQNGNGAHHSERSEAEVLVDFCRHN